MNTKIPPPPLLRRQIAATFTNDDFDFDDNPVTYRSQLIARFYQGSKLLVVLHQLVSSYKGVDSDSDSDSDSDYIILAKNI
jgi:hypothetical protein